MKKRVSISKHCIKLVKASDIVIGSYGKNNFSEYVEGLVKNDLAPVRVETSFQEHIELLKHRGWGIRYPGTVDVWKPIASH